MTTHITDVEIFLRKNPTSRDRVPKDLKLFKKLYDDSKSNMVTARSAASKRQADKKAAEDYKKGLSGKSKSATSENNPKAPATPAETFVLSQGWTLTNYVHHWGSNLALMPHAFNREQRLASRIGTRMVVMSGLTWNRESHSQLRDWTNVVTAITLETAIVASYRKDLLKACPGACALRKEIHTYLYDISMSIFIADRQTGESELSKEWSFPDGISLEVRMSGGKSYTPEDMMKELGLSEIAGPVPKGRRADVLLTINTLLGNKLLWSSDPDAPYKSIETILYRCVETIAHVSASSIHLSTHRSPLLVLRGCISTRPGWPMPTKGGVSADRRSNPRTS